MEQTLSLSCYIIEWMQTFKAYSIKQSTYMHLYGDGFDEIYSALIPEEYKPQTPKNLRFVQLSQY